MITASYVPLPVLVRGASRVMVSGIVTSVALTEI
jgi:hypothetical protein